MLHKMNPQESEINRIVLGEAAILLARNNKKYKGRVRSVTQFMGTETGLVSGATYFLLRYIDDIVDEDRIDPEIEHPFEWAQTFCNKIATATFADSTIPEKLTAYVLKVLERSPAQAAPPKQDLIRAIQAIVYDYKRSHVFNQETGIWSNSTVGDVLTEKQLDQYYTETFQPLHSLLLTGLRSTLPLERLRLLPIVQGQVYSARDLENDVLKGIYNIPQEVLAAANLIGNPNFEELKASKIISKWTADTLMSAEANIYRIRQEVFSIKHPVITSVIFMLTEQMLSLIEKQNLKMLK